MGHFISKIHVNSIFKLKDLDILIDENKRRHLLITGKNGCGKTSLLNALADFLQQIKDDKNLYFLNTREHYKSSKQRLSSLKKDHAQQPKIHSIQGDISYQEEKLTRIYGKLEPTFSDIYKISELVQSNDYIFAFYGANRLAKVVIPQNPDKPNLTPDREIKKGKQSEFVKFLVDLKIQSALAQNEGMSEDANEINKWFSNFTELLKRIFNDENLELIFNYRDYSFKIKQDNHTFGFNELSDGYSAIIDIIADLILKMQSEESLTRSYEKSGIVLIDEIETHLHIELQRHILPLLTTVFPNIQFIVSTHSPFILNSIDNSVAYDLENKRTLDNLTEYSYKALAEGYFNLETNNSFLQSKIERFDILANKEDKDYAEQTEFNELDEELSKLDDNTSPSSVITKYQEIKLKTL